MALFWRGVRLETIDVCGVVWNPGGSKSVTLICNRDSASLTWHSIRHLIPLLASVWCAVSILVPLGAVTLLQTLIGFWCREGICGLISVGFLVLLFSSASFVTGCLTEWIMFFGNSALKPVEKFVINYITLLCNQGNKHGQIYINRSAIS